MGKRGWQITFFLPVAVLYLWLIGGGFFKIFMESLGHLPTFGMTGYTTKYYQTVLTGDGFLRDFIFTLYIAITSATFSALGGTYIAYRLVRTERQWLKNITTRLMQLGMVLPYLYMVFVVMILFGRTGLYSRLLYGFGIIGQPEDFPALVFDPNGIGIQLVFICKGIPFVTLFLLNLMNSINKTYEGVAQSLGASDYQIFRRIYVPICSDSTVWSLMILMAFDIGVFEVPYLIGSLKPSSLSVRLFSAYMTPSIESLPLTMAIAVILFIIGFIAVALYGRLMKKLLMSKGLIRGQLARSNSWFRPLLNLIFILFSISSIMAIIWFLLLSINSFFRFPDLFPKGFTLGYWRTLLTRNTLFWGSLGSSVLIATTTAILATIIGFMAGRGVALYFGKKSSPLLMYISIPLFIPGMSLFLGAHQMLIHTPFANSWIGVVLAHLLICIPYTTNIAVAYFKGIPLELEQAAKNLGSNWIQSFRRLIFPMILPGVGLSLTIAFLISNTEYFSTFLIGGGNTITLSMIMYPYIANSDYGLGSVTGIIFVLLHLLVFLLFDRFINKRITYQALYGGEL